jgi:hypothetical protein
MMYDVMVCSSLLILNTVVLYCTSCRATQGRTYCTIVHTKIIGMMTFAKETHTLEFCSRARENEITNPRGEVIRFRPTGIDSFD